MDANNTTGADPTNNSMYKQSMPIMYLLAVAYGLVFLLCIMGNVLVCVVVAKNKSMRTVTNYFIVNLAVSDLLVGVVCIPVTLVDNLTIGWMFGAVMCKLTPIVQGISLAASILTLVAIAVDRYLAVITPTEGKLTNMRTFVIIVVIWLSGMAMIFPLAFVMHYDPEKHFCKEDWAGDGLRNYTLSIFVLCYVAPLTAITVMYIRVAVRLYQSTMRSSVQGATRSGIGPKRAKLGNKVRVFKMLVVVVVLFTLLHLPLHTVQMLADYGNLEREDLRRLYFYAFPAAHWLTFFNSCVNPIVYGCMNRNFRSGFAATFPNAANKIFNHDFLHLSNISNLFGKRTNELKHSNEESQKSDKGPINRQESAEMEVMGNEVTKTQNGTALTTMGYATWVSQL
ncbi:PREDICTED: neuropeptide FF receptor 2-like [Branchiostoma belcheri]|uniref:Neuropeptide FF receptor 2-like n=1 Tax=Branchiostoma belcheri TaxID=7741 RepID=A0A6P4XRI9_BRABE|nr:PREDICTED: neuropeptide FF receptor 2-like [Branchiostoma belcheri]KAI8505163.1 Neuropeptide FF receptor 2 [Branchiostoma belcheri]